MSQQQQLQMGAGPSFGPPTMGPNMAGPPTMGPNMAGPPNCNNPLYNQISPHSVASALALIGVDPGYYSDSDVSSNSSDKQAESGQTSPATGRIAVPIPPTAVPTSEPQMPENNSSYNCFNDYFSFNELVKPMPLRWGPETQAADPWRAVQEGQTQDSAASETSEGSSYTPSTSPQSCPTPTTPPTIAKKGNGKRSKPQVCVFCRNNGEDESVYSTHALKAPDGKVTCPILFAYECPICRATGETAHTLKYCPRNPNGQGNNAGNHHNGGQGNNNNNSHHHNNNNHHSNGGNHSNGGYQGYSGSSNMGYSNSRNQAATATPTPAPPATTPAPANQNVNLMQAMLQMAGGNPALAQLNFNMASMLYQQQQQQQQQPSNPFAAWVQQQQSYNKSTYPSTGAYNNNPSSTGAYNNNPSYNNNNTNTGYGNSDYGYAQEAYPASAAESTYNTPSNRASPTEEVDNLSQLFGKAGIEDFLQSYSR